MKFIKEHTDEAIIQEAHKRLNGDPGKVEYLIGGFNIDNIILAMYHELNTYYFDEDEIWERIESALESLYEGALSGD